MKDKTDLARAWLEKSDSDLNTARWITDGPGPFDKACFHAQQATEKALKAFLLTMKVQSRGLMTWMNCNDCVLNFVVREKFPS